MALAGLLLSQRNLAARRLHGRLARPALLGGDLLQRSLQDIQFLKVEKDSIGF